MIDIRGRREARLHRIKRPAGLYTFEVEQLCEDRDGTWLYGRIGSRWNTLHEIGEMPVAIAILLATDRPWAVWWIDDPVDRRIEIDVCLPPERVDNGWVYVDLDLEVTRHEPDQLVEIEDWDEHERAVAAGWMSFDEALLARATAEAMTDTLRRDEEPWLARGWQLLAEAAEQHRDAEQAASPQVMAGG